jgi:hypothetical protein
MQTDLSPSGGVRTRPTVPQAFASHSPDREWEHLVEHLGSPIEPRVLQRVAELRAQGWQLRFALFTRQLWLFRRLCEAD